jgi:hypothetical protein
MTVLDAITGLLLLFGSGALVGLFRGVSNGGR